MTESGKTSMIQCPKCLTWSSPYNEGPHLCSVSRPMVAVLEMQEACAKLADRAAESDLEYAAKYDDEREKFENRAHRATTIAIGIRALSPFDPNTKSAPDFSQAWGYCAEGNAVSAPEQSGEAEATPMAPVPQMMLEMCWRDELFSICQRTKTCLSKRPTRTEMVKALLDLSPLDLQAEVCTELRGRDARWRADAPVGAVAFTPDERTEQK